jgi:hypothetical protein
MGKTKQAQKKLIHADQFYQPEIAASRRSDLLFNAGPESSTCCAVAA